MAESTITSTSNGSAPTGLGIQQHVIYAANSGRWWAFWFSSSSVLSSAYSSDGATWTAGATKTLAQSQNDGRNLSLAYQNISSTDVVHFGISYASGATQYHYHLRATISGTTVTYGTESQIATTTDNSGLYDGETVVIDANNKVVETSFTLNSGDGHGDGNNEAAEYPNADTGSSWTQGTPTVDDVNPDNFSQSGSWLGVLSASNLVDVGANAPSASQAWTNLMYSVNKGTGFATSAAVLASNLGTAADPNDFGAVVLDSTHVMVVWRNAGTNIQYRIGTVTVSTQTISWTTAAALPTSGLTQPASGTSGFALISDGSKNVWLFVIDSGTGNPVKYCQFSTSTAGAWTSGSWGSWTTQESTSATRTYVGISQQNDGSGNANYLLYWSESAAVKGELFATASGATNISVSDSGTGAQTVSLGTITPAVTDSATGSQSVSLGTISASVSDSATGTDTPSLGTITPAVSDTASGTDTPTLGTISPSVTDAGTGGEAEQITATVPLTDTATGHEAISGLGGGTPVTLADSATGSEQVSLGTVTPSVPDTGSGTEQLAGTTTLSASDTASGADSPQITASIPEADTGTGTDTPTLGPVALGVGETAAGSDVPGLASPVAVGISESGAGSELVGVLNPNQIPTYHILVRVRTGKVQVAVRSGKVTMRTRTGKMPAKVRTGKLTARTRTGKITEKVR